MVGLLGQMVSSREESHLEILVILESEEGESVHNIYTNQGIN